VRPKGAQRAASSDVGVGRCARPERRCTAYADARRKTRTSLRIAGRVQPLRRLPVYEESSKDGLSHACGVGLRTQATRVECERSASHDHVWDRRKPEPLDDRGEASTSVIVERRARNVMSRRHVDLCPERGGVDRRGTGACVRRSSQGGRRASCCRRDGGVLRKGNATSRDAEGMPSSEGIVDRTDPRGSTAETWHDFASPWTVKPTAAMPRDELGRPTRRKTKRPSERRSPESTPASDPIATSDLILEADHRVGRGDRALALRGAKARTRKQTPRDVHASGRTTAGADRARHREG
jgi:hypothetical protein